MALMIRGLAQISKELPFKVRHLRYCLRIKNKTLLEYHQMRNHYADLSVIMACCRHIPKIVFDALKALFNEQSFNHTVFRFCLYEREKIHLNKMIFNDNESLIELSIVTKKATMLVKIDLVFQKIKKINVRLTLSKRTMIRHIFGNTYFYDYFDEFKNENDLDAMTISINFIYQITYRMMNEKMRQTYRQIEQFLQQLPAGESIFSYQSENQQTE